MTHPLARGRAFRLHLPHLVLDGWITATGKAVVIEDDDLGLTASAPTLTDLIRGYGRGRIEWLPPAHAEPAPPAQQGGQP